jgi:hypothetical protein
MFFMWRMKKNKAESGEGTLSALDDLPIPGLHTRTHAHTPCERLPDPRRATRLRRTIICGAGATRSRTIICGAGATRGERLPDPRRAGAQQAVGGSPAPGVARRSAPRRGHVPPVICGRRGGRGRAFAVFSLTQKRHTRLPSCWTERRDVAWDASHEERPPLVCGARILSYWRG